MEHPMPKSAALSQPERGALADASSLLLAVGRGDQSAFARLYDAVSGRLFGLVTAIVRDRSAAEDVLQESFMQIWRRASTFDPDRADAMVWMSLIARGKAIDHLRRRGASHAAHVKFGNLLPPAPSPESPVARGSLRAAAMQAFSALPAEQKEALTLAYFGGLSGAEIAEARGIPLGTVKTRIRTGLERLREAFSTLREVST